MNIKKIIPILITLINVLIIFIFYVLLLKINENKYKKSYSTHEVNKINISIILLVKNNYKWLKNLNHYMKIIEEKYEHLVHFEYFIYENNSNDGTKKYIRSFMRDRKGKFFMEDLSEIELKEYKFTDPISKERGELMAMLRNKLKGLHGELRSDYTVLIDSDVYFDFTVFMKMIEVMNKNKDVVMVTPFVSDFSDKLEYDNNHYYDTFALITNDNLDFTNVGLCCLFKQCQKCKKTREIKNIKISEDKLLDSNSDLIEVKSAFGSMAMVKTNVYNKVEWEGTICEHISFCEKVREHGKIVIAPKIRITNNA